MADKTQGRREAQGRAPREKMLAEACQFVRDNLTMGAPNAAGITTLDIGETSMKVVVSLGWAKEGVKEEDCYDLFEVAVQAVEAVMSERGYVLEHATAMQFYSQRKPGKRIH